MSVLFIFRLRKEVLVRGVEGRVGRWSSEFVGVFFCGSEGQSGGRFYRQFRYKVIWFLRKFRYGQSRWYLVLESAQLKSRGFFCRKYFRSGWAKVGYRWFIFDSVLLQGICSLGGYYRQRVFSGRGEAGLFQFGIVYFFILVYFILDYQFQKAMFLGALVQILGCSFFFYL